MDVRESIYDRVQLGMSEIRISRHPLRKDIIVALHHTEHDIYLDVADSSEFARIFKQAIVRKNVDMDYVQEQFGVLAEPDDILPFHILFTRTGVPRPPKLDDRIIIDGAIYVVSKLKPTNRELTAIYECLVYPERDARRVNDPLAIYYVRFRRGTKEVTGNAIYTDPVIMEIVYGGCPTLMSFDGKHWQRFYQRSGVTIPSWTDTLYIMDAEQRTAQLEFGKTFSVESPFPTYPLPEENYLDVDNVDILFEEPLAPHTINVVAQPEPHIEVPASYRQVSYGEIVRVYPTSSNDYYVQFTYVLESEVNGRYTGHYDVEVVGYDISMGGDFCFPFAVVAGNKKVCGSVSFKPTDAIIVNPETLYFGWNDTEPQKINVIANGEWKITAQPSDATIVIPCCPCDTNVLVSFKEPNTGIDFTGEIVFERGEAKAIVTVVREGLYDVFDASDGEFLVKTQENEGALANWEQMWVIKQKYYGIQEQIHRTENR